MSGWTNERVELLKKLWADGVNASQIAGRFGDLTRNAVIGKVHRLGLGGRATTSRGRPPKKVAGGGPSFRPTRLSPGPRGNVHRAFNAMVRHAIQPGAAVAVLEQPPTQLPQALRIDLLDLKECMCRWPFGDPQDDDFYFCGHSKDDRVPYCEHHARIAFQPASRRKR